MLVCVLFMDCAVPDDSYGRNYSSSLHAHVYWHQINFYCLDVSALLFPPGYTIIQSINHWIVCKNRLRSGTFLKGTVASPQLGIKPTAIALQAQFLNHYTTLLPQWGERGEVLAAGCHWVLSRDVGDGGPTLVADSRTFTPLLSPLQRWN